MWNVINQVRVCFMLSISFLCLTNAGFSQGCFDADFESGTVGGYESYQGRIESDGSLNFFTAGVSPDQHKIMAIEDGVDPIAEMYCITNKFLPVAGQGAGRYSLRLGDYDGGRRTSKVVLSFEVTPNVSFFLLKYAVILEDPMHDEHEQPRFQMNIKDQLGNILECGEYSVTAAGEIPGFEVCGDWRVRPWTTAGFELQSYIGQTINIEIISTDCALGAHGGYAYIDATCKPLELVLDSYCPDSAFAKYYVTEGFDTYAWNTGDDANIIEIENAMPGQEYSVTVTSSTGCTLVLRDTLPELPNIDDLDFSFFDGPDTLVVCEGDEISYTPTGTNIGVVEAIELGYSAETFYMFANDDRRIRFVTRDNFGCLYDTMELNIIVKNIEVDIEANKTCVGESNGSIIINHLGEGTVMTSIANGPLTSDLIYENLASGGYNIIVQNQFGCEYESEVSVISIGPPSLNQTNITGASCGLENGQINVSSFDSEIEYSFEGSAFSSVNSWSDLAGGTYSLNYKNSTGCTSMDSIEVPRYDTPELSVTNTDTIFCGNDDGLITCSTVGGQEPLQYSIDGSFGSMASYSDLSPGEYIVMVRDEANCTDTVRVNLIGDPYVTIDEVITTPANCEENNGAMEIILQNEEITYDIYMDNEIITDLYVDGLTAGLYTLLVEDDNGCTDSHIESLEIVKPPEMGSVLYTEQECGDNTVSAIVNAITYTDGISYSVNGSPLQSGQKIELFSGENTVYIIDDFGCEKDTLIVLPDTEQYGLANIFSPNGDGNNDFFCFENVNGVDHIKYIYIFDRWGNRVFAIEDANSLTSDLCWDGMYNNSKVDLGVYVYHIQARLVDGRLLCKSGDVTVL